MLEECIVVGPSDSLRGTAELYGAKNAVLVIMTSLLLTRGKSTLTNVPASSDVFQMITLFEELGVDVYFDRECRKLHVDTSTFSQRRLSPEPMNKMRASILVLGPLLARFGKAQVALPGGCPIGPRPIDFHVHGFRKMGVSIKEEGKILSASVESSVTDARVTFDYPSVGATENVLLFAVLKAGETTLINAALEPEVLDLIAVLNKMGAKITVLPAGMIHIVGVAQLQPVTHEILPDRLEAGALLLATAMVGGEIALPQAQAYAMDIFLEKLREMGHEVVVGKDGVGILLRATRVPKAVSFKTGPYPGFPTDLQAPMMALQTVAEGTSIVEETVFENRFMHVRELYKMGAQITVDGMTATVRGVKDLYGTKVIATDIRAACALAIVGFVAHDETIIVGVPHWRRAYDSLERKLALLGGNISVVSDHEALRDVYANHTARIERPSAHLAR